MSQSFALPCPCGAAIAVEVRQAGDRAQCPKCQQFVEVPRLRELKRLEPLANSSTTVGQDATAWSGLPGALFAFGLLALAISAAAGYYTHYTKTQFEEYAAPPPEKIEFERDIREITLVDSWETWKNFKKLQLSRRPQPIHVMAQSRIAALNSWLMLFAGLATLGLLCMVISFLVRPKKKP